MSDKDVQQRTLDEVKTARIGLMQAQKGPVRGTLDVLVAGAGPAGTAAAFRAKELGLAVLVVDRDEALSILRDWISPDGNPENDKAIEHSYGTGLKSPFPVAGQLVAQLRYEDGARSGELYRRWLGVYAEQSIPVRAGLEVSRLERLPDGAWGVDCVGLSTGTSERFTAKAVVLALGRGRPKALEMLGDTGGIGSKLRELLPRAPGAPVCVIGGGIAATEAVISLSEAKAAAGDTTYVYWSFRGQKPRYNRNLAEGFFKASIGNGNVRLLPYSNALAVLKGRDGLDHVAVRIDERESPGQATASTYLEFPKERVLACIGADVPVEVLDASRITYVVRPPDPPPSPGKGKSEEPQLLMRVSPLLETNLRGVFLAGGMLAESYVEAVVPSPDGEEPAEVSHPNNFKPALADGVLVVEAIHLRAQGRSDTEIAAHVDERRREFAAKSRPAEVGPPSPPSVSQPSGRQAQFMRLKAVMGKPEEIDLEPYVFPAGRVRFGRAQGALTFPDDEKMVEDHAELIVGLDTCYVSTEGMAGEAFVAVQSERVVEAGQEIWVGDFLGGKAHRLRVEHSAQGVALSLLDPAHDYHFPRATWAIPAEWHEFRRDDIALGDMRMSRRHFAVCAQGYRLRVFDLGSLNGTYLRVPKDSALRLQPRDVVAVGGQLLRFMGFGEVVVGEPLERPKDKLRSDSKVISVKPQSHIVLRVGAEETLMQALDKGALFAREKEKLGGRAQCLGTCEGQGSCKLDLVRIVSGADQLMAPTSKEKGGIYRARVEALRAAKKLSHPADAFRLACQCRAKSMAEVEIELFGDTDVDE